MAINDINDADIREYILGRSGAANTERLDELSFFDEYSEHFGAVEREIIDDYLTGQLSPGERLAFESNYVSSPLRRAKVDFARALRVYSRNQSKVAPVHISERSIFEVFRTWRLAFQFGAAALVVCIGITGWLVFRNPSSFEIAQSNTTDHFPDKASNANVEVVPTSLPEPSHTPRAQTKPSGDPTAANRPAATPAPRPTRRTVRQPSLAIFTLTPALRSSAFQELKVSDGAKIAEFRMQLEAEERGPFLVEVLDLRGRSRVWSARNLSSRKGDYGSTVRFRIPARVLGAGEYQISLLRSKPGDDPEKIGDYFVRVAP